MPGSKKEKEQKKNKKAADIEKKSSKSKSDAKKNSGKKGKPIKTGRVVGLKDKPVTPEYDKQRRKRIKTEVVILVTIAVCACLFLSNFALLGPLGNLIANYTFGFFGILAYVFPFILFTFVIAAVVSKKSGFYYIVKVILGCLLIMLLASIIQLSIGKADRDTTVLGYFALSKVSKSGGGMLGGFLLSILLPSIDTVGTYVILISALLLFTMLFSGRTLFTGLGGATRNALENRKKNYSGDEEDVDEDEDEDEDASIFNDSKKSKEYFAKVSKKQKKKFKKQHKELDKEQSELRKHDKNKYDEDIMLIPDDAGYDEEKVSDILERVEKEKKRNKLREKLNKMENQEETKRNFLGGFSSTTPYKVSDKYETKEVFAPDVSQEAEDENENVNSNQYPMPSEITKVVFGNNKNRVDNEVETNSETENVQENAESTVVENTIIDRGDFEARLASLNRRKEMKAFSNMKAKKKKKRHGDEEDDELLNALDISWEEAKQHDSFETSSEFVDTEDENYEKQYADSSNSSDVLNMYFSFDGKNNSAEYDNDNENYDDTLPESVDVDKDTYSDSIPDNTENDVYAEPVPENVDNVSYLDTISENEENDVYEETITEEINDVTDSYSDDSVTESSVNTAEDNINNYGYVEPDFESNELDFSDSKLRDMAMAQAVSKEAKEEFERKPFSADATLAARETVLRNRQAAQEVFSQEHVKPNHQVTIPEYIDNKQETDTIADAKPIKPYQLPPIDLLNPPKSNTLKASDEELNATAESLKSTLESFNVHVTINNISVGPSITRFEIQPEQGVKVARITALADDIKLNLAAQDIRIEAPIPGKAAVGIEVPNKHSTMVTLREILDAPEFKNHLSKVSFGVGKDIAGMNIIGDVSKMPHMLIAGATGSGKSVCINTILISILYKASSEDVKFIMIDPKMVELSVYNGIPHLLDRVVTDPKKAANALNWAVDEMNKRYAKFAEASVRDIKGYNDHVERNNALPGVTKKEKLPQIIIVIDELSDLMAVCQSDVEVAICRLAQMARAAGMFLIIATQRPSVNVITGLIKANVPSRIAFAVSSQVDSRTIIDQVGAEKLLGKGDMLYYPTGMPKPIRLQGAFVSDDEVNRVVEFVRSNNAEYVKSNTEVSDRINKVAKQGSQSSFTEEVEDELDELFEIAGKDIIKSQKASIGNLQRAYRIGFNRASRIMSQLADAKVVGPEEGKKPREVLMTLEEFEAYLEEFR